MRLAAIVVLVLVGCAPSPAPPSPVDAGWSPPAPAAPAASDPPEARALREQLVARVSRSVTDESVLAAIRKVPRHLFVPTAPLREAYADHPVAIGLDQTISQPTIVGVMTQALRLTGKERVLEIGTGSGYQAAVLSGLCAEVFTIELLPELGEQAKKRLAELGYANVHVKIGDGYKGWPEKAPFDRVIVTAAPPEIPKPLLDQLKDGGLLVAPVGPTSENQTLFRFAKRGSRVEREDLGPVRFVPMVPGKE